MRIGLIGCAGLGKGAICQRVAEQLNIDFVESKSATRPVLKKAMDDCSTYGFVETRLAKKDYEFEIVVRRMQLEQDHKNFITDRTALECFAYAYLRLDTYTQKEFSLFEQTCREQMKFYTQLVYIPFDYGWQGENGVRTVNREFQWMADKMISTIIDRWGLKTFVPVKGDVDYIAQQIVQKVK